MAKHLFGLLVVCCLSINVGFVSGQHPPFTESCRHGQYPPSSKPSIKEYIINLDLPPTERWKEVAQDKKQEIKNVLQAFKNFVDDFGDIAAEVVYFVDLLGPLVINSLPQPYRDEMRGISAVTGLEIGEITIYNIFYEIFSVCTSIIAEDHSGKLYHVRNLDFGLFMGWDVKNRTWSMTETLRPSIVNLDFQRAGTTVYKAASYAGYVGITTAMSKGKFTLTLNERFKLDGGYMGFIELLLHGKGVFMGFLTRHVMETANSFDEAKQMLSETQLIAPAYFILGGNTSGEACVITRDRDTNNTDIWDMRSAGGWYILQTNYDHWAPPLFLDDRRTPGNICMKNLTQKGVGIPGLFDVLSTKPVLNKLTTYTSLMQVNSGHMETWLQDCEDPCFPW